MISYDASFLEEMEPRHQEEFATEFKETVGEVDLQTASTEEVVQLARAIGNVLLEWRVSVEVSKDLSKITSD